MTEKKETQLETITRISNYLIAADAEDELEVILDETIDRLEVAEALAKSSTAA